MPELPLPSKRFRKGLLNWNEHENQRDMPWKGEKDPYKIWLSEVILQQTRVEQGWHYYEKFVSAFPTVSHLAKAPERKVLKLWEGLGYYSRCRNLIYTARFIEKELKGRFPRDYPSILALKGIGPYTAAAIASFAFDLPFAVLDGNVFRVLSRIYDIDTPVDSTEGKKVFEKLAYALLPPDQPGVWNQAMMDFGATICKPLPLCADCFFNRYCGAYIAGRQTMLPVKGKKIIKRERWFHYVILSFKGAIAMRKRDAGDIWQSLYEPVLIEHTKQLGVKKLFAQFEKEFGLANQQYHAEKTIHLLTQQLTHQTIHFSFHYAVLNEKKPLPGYVWVKETDLIKYPLPKTISELLKKR